MSWNCTKSDNDIFCSPLLAVAVSSSTIQAWLNNEKKQKQKKRHLMWSDEIRGWNLLVSLAPAGKNTKARHPENTAPPRSIAEAVYGSELQWPGVYVWIKHKAWVRQKVGVCFGRSGPESDIWGGDLRWALHRRRSCNLTDLERFSKEP